MDSERFEFGEVSEVTGSGRARGGQHIPSWDTVALCRKNARVGTHGQLTPSHPASPTGRLIRGDDVVRDDIGGHHGQQRLCWQVRGQEQERAVGFLNHHRVGQHSALPVQPQGVGRRHAAQVGRALPLQEGRRILTSNPNDRGVGGGDSSGHQRMRQSQASACRTMLA